ncbi:hypothetical protein SISNIDRAFT_449643 [Sistotremastrum niveocremeum HHB9708]|uniref:RING-type domain-containing protein n=1 Tax=Sistotremastrum niveocremeum HHB9708 TaxID=1314777 RepID=A0A164ZSL2_9AGAM|nr:hypothetical protein SISNIDRAFT_449643 [Sistotremastrum niveocremeum HHB9708]
MNFILDPHDLETIDNAEFERFTTEIVGNLPANMFDFGTRRRDKRIDDLIATLPHLSEKDLSGLDLTEVTCPICYVPFASILAEEEYSLAMDNSPAVVPEELGVTKLDRSCGHIYCRKDIIKWMRGANGSCPTCRQPFLPPLPTSPESETVVPTGAQGDQDAAAIPAELQRVLDQQRREYEEFLRWSGQIPAVAQSQQTQPDQHAPPQDLESRLGNAGVLTDFQRLLFGSSGIPASLDGGRSQDSDRAIQGHDDSDREAYSSMYS